MLVVLDNQITSRSNLVPSVIWSDNRHMEWYCLLWKYPLCRGRAVFNKVCRGVFIFQQFPIYISLWFCGKTYSECWFFPRSVERGDIILGSPMTDETVEFTCGPSNRSRAGNWTTELVLNIWIKDNTQYL